MTGNWPTLISGFGSLRCMYTTSRFSIPTSGLNLHTHINTSGHGSSTFNYPTFKSLLSLSTIKSNSLLHTDDRLIKLSSFYPLINIPSENVILYPVKRSWVREDDFPQLLITMRYI